MTNKQHVIYLPGAVKNLISISQWSKDKQDNCAILSRGSYSIFLWNHDKHSKVIEHSPDCAIPMMPVNEQVDKFALFADKHAVKFDSIPPVSIENQLFEITSLNPEHIDRKTTDKQSKVEPIDAPRNPASNSNEPGDTVRVWDDGKWKIAIVDEVRRLISDNPGYLVRLLNSPKKIFVPSSSIRGFHPDPSDFPSNPSEVDTKELTHTLTKEELRQLWAPSTDDTISPESRITLYWHHRLRCAPLRTLQRLSIRGVLPRCIQKVSIMPLCASCAFATAHRKSWRHKGARDSHISKPNQVRPGDGTSCDHIISHQPGLIPQVSGKLTHERYWGSVLYVDHFSDYLFNHLITGTTNEQTLSSILAYERVAQQHDVRGKAYHADNLRFNDNNFRGECIKLGQQLTFSGVGAHHQNAIAESKVKLVCHGA